MATKTNTTRYSYKGQMEALPARTPACQCSSGPKSSLILSEKSYVFLSVAGLTTAGLAEPPCSAFWPISTQ